MTAVLFAYALMAMNSIAAQSGDPVSGAWKGYMARDSDRMPLTITLRFDGNSMTGTVEGPPTPGIVKTGTFDKLSGALKFQVEVQDTAKTIVTLDGMLADDRITGSVILNNQNGTFNLTKGAAAAAPASAATLRSPRK